MPENPKGYAAAVPQIVPQKRCPPVLYRRGHLGKSLGRHSVEHLTVGTEDCRESYISQNRYLVDHAQYLVAVSEEHREQETGSFQVTTYAREKGLEIIYIHPDTAEVTDVPK